VIAAPLTITTPVQPWNEEQTRLTSVVELEPGIEELAERSRAGCRASFEALVSHFEKRIFHYLYQMTRNQHDAEDLTQVTFLKAYQNIHAYQSNRAFHAWLFTIAKRTALNHFRDSRPVEELPPELEANTETPSVALEKKDARSAIWKLAQALKPNQYEALWLRYAQGLSITETARVMKTNSIRVRVLLHRGRAALAKRLAPGTDASLAPG
jgi:RNA polymerase sigma-70 factor, ECF subfamily